MASSCAEQAIAKSAALSATEDDAEVQEQTEAEAKEAAATRFRIKHIETDLVILRQTQVCWELILQNSANRDCDVQTWMIWKQNAIKHPQTHVKMGVTDAWKVAHAKIQDELGAKISLNTVKTRYNPLINSSEKELDELLLPCQNGGDQKTLEQELRTIVFDIQSDMRESADKAEGNAEFRKQMEDRSQKFTEASKQNAAAQLKLNAEEKIKQEGGVAASSGPNTLKQSPAASRDALMNQHHQLADLQLRMLVCQHFYFVVLVVHSNITDRRSR